MEAYHTKKFCTSHSHESACATHFESQDSINSNAAAADDDKARGNSEEDNAVNILNEKKGRRKFNKQQLQNVASVLPEGCSCKVEERHTCINNESPVVMSENEVQMLVKPKANSMQGSPSEMSKEVLSVTGIIDRYFPRNDRIDNFSSPSHSDVTSRAIYEVVDNQSISKTVETTPSNVLHTPLVHVESVAETLQSKRRESKVRKRVPSVHVDSVSGTLQDKRRESKLRKRLLAASRSLGLSPNLQSPTLSLCRFRDEKVSLHKSQTIGSLFDISDNDD